MRFSVLTTILYAAAAAFAAPAPRDLPTAHVTADGSYDDPNTSLDIVACSNGPNGLLTKGTYLPLHNDAHLTLSTSCPSLCTGYFRLGDLPTFPNIGGYQNATWGSPLCGTCWRLNFNQNSLDVLVVDYTVSGFNLAWPAFESLTSSTGGLLPEVEVTYQQVPLDFCGM